ncbi:50S ribosomal protein L15 [Rapidithrix thailandica]|uniref:Large ribosomal subunit protein uL15 n=1 Tax=Rapidithrix thailandica TaxID=413964 RepID=A0AAW9RSH7_9BACT
MKLHTLKPAQGSTKNNKRVGRGQGSGRGGTSTRGHKGAKSRSGYSKKLGFEGGQMPLQRRIPKFGFNNPNRVEYVPVNLDVIQKLAEEKNIQKFGMEEFIANGLVSKNDKVKVLGRGEIKASVKVETHAISASAKENIEKAGGSVTIL